MKENRQMFYSYNWILDLGVISKINVYAVGEITSVCGISLENYPEEIPVWICLNPSNGLASRDVTFLIHIYYGATQSITPVP